MKLVDEEDDLALRLGDLFQERFKPFLELAAEFRARQHRADVHGDDLLVLHGVGHVAGNDAPRQPFHDGGLADARLADEHRVVFCPPGKHLEHAPDLVVAPDHRIDLSRPRPGC